MRYLLFALLPVILSAAGATTPDASLRLRPSANGHYLQSGDGSPVYILADTAWSLSTEYSREEIISYLDHTATQGFNTIQLNAIFARKWNSEAALEAAFHHQQLNQPIDAYWKQFDWVVRQITERGLYASINPIWTKFTEACLIQNGPEACQQFGQWFARRYVHNPRVIYFVGGDKSPENIRPEIHALASGIQAVYQGKALLSYHSSSDSSSREVFPEAPDWLTLNWTYAYCPAYRKDFAYAQNQANYALSPATPIQFGEGYYDLGRYLRRHTHGTADRWANRDALRRQLWWASYLTGGSGYAYGAEAIWKHQHDDKTWRDALRFDSRQDIRHFKTLLDTLPWWTLQPDPDHRCLKAPAGTTGTYDYTAAALNPDRTLAVLYTPVAQNLALDRQQLAPGQLTAQWFDPSNGKFRKAQSNAQGSYPSPGTNAAGDHDFVLILKVN